MIFLASVFAWFAVLVFASRLHRRHTQRPPKLKQQAIDSQFWQIAAELRAAPYQPSPRPAPSDGDA